MSLIRLSSEWTGSWCGVSDRGQKRSGSKSLLMMLQLGHSDLHGEGWISLWFTECSRLASLVTPAEAGFTGQEKDDEKAAEAGSTF